MFFLSLICGLLGFTGCILELYKLIKRQQWMVSTFVRFAYCMVYGILPCVIYGQIANGITINSGFQNNNITVGNGCFILLSSLVGYGCFNLGLLSKRKVEKGIEKNDSLAFKYESSFNTVIIILVAIGWIGLVLWTSSYGSINLFMQEAARIRSGYGIQNKYAFMAHFARCLVISTPLLIIKKKKSSIMVAITVASCIGCVFYFACSDARTMVALVLFTIFFAYEERNALNNMRSMSRRLLLSGLALVLIFLFATIASSSLDVLRYKQNVVDTSFDFDIIGAVTREYNHLVRGQQKVAEVLFTDQYKWLLPSDIVNSLFAWIPSSIIPFDMPVKIWNYNTELLGWHANQPTDIITSSFYLFWLLGPCILMFIYGKTVALVDKWLEKVSDYQYEYYLVMKYLLAFRMFNWVMYYQLYSIVYESFFIFITIILMYMFTRTKTNKKTVIIRI